jgi:hypothetical protein
LIKNDTNFPTNSKIANFGENLVRFCPIAYKGWIDATYRDEK